MATTNDCDRGETGFDDIDLHHFILLKRAKLPKSSIELLKDKSLENFHPDSTFSKECNGLPNESRPYHLNQPNSCKFSDHDGLHKSTTNDVKNAKQHLNELTLAKIFRDRKNIFTKSQSVGKASLQHFLKQTNSWSFMDEENDANTCEQGSADHHGGAKQSQDDNSSGYIPTSNENPDNHIGSPPSELHQSQKKNDQHDDRNELQVADTDSSDVQLLDKSSISQPCFPPSEFNHSQKKNDQHDDRNELQVADTDSSDVQLLDQSSIPQPCSPQTLCIICRRSGRLMKCHGDGCLRSIHDNCISLLCSNEKNGLFYCPFCAYRNARLLYIKSKRKVQEARKILYSFYDIGSEGHVQKRKKFSEEIVNGNDHASINHHNPSDNIDLASNKQVCNGSGEQKHDETQGAETISINPGITRCLPSYQQFSFSPEVQKHHGTQNVEKSYNYLPEIAQNPHNYADDLGCKVILPCRETIECHTEQVVQDTPATLKSACREHETRLVTEDLQHMNEHEINDNGNSPSNECNTSCERNGDTCIVSNRNENEVCYDQSRVEEIKNVHTDNADQENDHDAKRKDFTLQISDAFANRNKREKLVKSHNRMLENQHTENSSLRHLRKITYQQNRLILLNRSPGRRTKLIWKPAEEEVLEKAMQKIPKNEDGTIPWTKILEFCRPVLHETRTPIDLKDKWRNMQKREAKAGV